jgi:hypothetical protein
LNKGGFLQPHLIFFIAERLGVRIYMGTTKKIIGWLTVIALAATVPTLASTIAEIESQPFGTPVTLGSSTDSTNPVITAIGSIPGSLDGYTYTTYAFIAQDSTGSFEIFSSLPIDSTYIPAVGDRITASGTYGSFLQIPELEVLTSIEATSTGNAVPAPTLVTIAQLNSYANVLPSSVAGHFLELHNVTISQQSVPIFPIHANGTYNLVDGRNSLEMFQWASSYSAAGMIGGTKVPTGAVDVKGIVNVFALAGFSGGITQFVPFSITPVPEPAAFGLMCVAALSLLRNRRAAK